MELTAEGSLPTLLAMAHAEGNDEKVVALVALNIVALDNYLHLRNRLTEVEVNTISRDIVDEFGGALSFADLYIVLRSARRGEYGKFYERLSGPDIMTWFSDYYERRLSASAEKLIVRNEHEYRPRVREPRSLGVPTKESEALGIGQIMRDKLVKEAEEKAKNAENLPSDGQTAPETNKYTSDKKITQ